jgi:hypothetical protein
VIIKIDNFVAKEIVMLEDEISDSFDFSFEAPTVSNFAFLN